MRNPLSISLVILAMLVPGTVAGAENGPSNVPALAVQLIDRISSDLSFSFLYDGKHSQEILPHWKQTRSSKSLEGGRQLHVTTYKDDTTGLEISSEVTLFSEARAVECLLRLSNTGTRDTPLLEKILPLDLQFAVEGNENPRLHYARGSMGKAEDFLPIDKEIAQGSDVSLSHYTLRGTDHVDGQLPFFNLQWHGTGLIGAVGWTGQWEVRVRGEDGRKVNLQAGQQTTHLKLLPGESIRTPSILLLQYAGDDRFTGHNQFRKLLLAHYVPKIDGEVVVPPLSNSNAFVYMYDAIQKRTGRDPLDVVAQVKNGDDKELFALANDALNWVNEKNQLEFIRSLPPFVENYWLDAGWFEGEWPFGVGSWVPDAKKFPHGMKPVGDAAHAKGMKFLLWFEPGRVGSGSLISTEHPGWVLHRPGEGKLGGLFNYGDPAARRWMTTMLSSRISDWGIDIYRQDSNICPLPFWQSTDEADRQGISEIHWVEGLYQLWDRLLRDHPKLMIDNANWRITGPDIEVMKRSVGSLTRSETECGGIPHPTATQVQTAELSLWIPIAAGTVNGFDPYVFRSASTSGVGDGLDIRSAYFPADDFKRGADELKSLRPFWLGDYYPLAEISLDERAWAGWELYRPDLKAGFAVFFRRSQSEQSSRESGIRGLDPGASFEVTFARSYEAGKKQRMTGEQLKNLRVEINEKKASVLIRFQQVGGN